MHFGYTVLEFLMFLSKKLENLKNYSETNHEQQYKAIKSQKCKNTYMKVNTFEIIVFFHDLVTWDVDSDILTVSFGRTNCNCSVI